MAQDIFIQSKKTFHFHDEHNDLVIPALFVGKLPEWAANTPLFKLAVSGGDITYVGAPPASALTDSAQEEPSKEDPKADANAGKASDTKGAAK